MSDERKPLERDEMVEILEGIARTGSDTARIAAIKALTTHLKADDDGDEATGFDALDPTDELAPRRDRRSA